jgi:cold shock CspA family protein
MAPQVFISYAKEDIAFAEKLRKDLIQAGIKPWMDSSDLLPGQNWELSISSAIRDCRYFIALLSSHSVGKKGYVQREIRNALKVAQEYPPDKVYIIPLRIDVCEPTFEDLKVFQIFNFFPDYDQCFKNILRVLEFETIEKPALINIDNGIRSGIIKKLVTKGFGFVTYDKWDYFFHSNTLVGVSFDELRENDSIYFKMAEGPKGMIAINVERA